MRFRRRRTGHAASVLVLAVGAFGTQVAGTTASAADPEWLATLNAWRVAAGVSPVTHDSAISVGAQNHACYTELHGPSHHEDPSKDRYTPSGHQAAQHGIPWNTHEDTTAQRAALEALMTAPMHSAWILSPWADRVGFGWCNTPQGWEHPSLTLDLGTGVSAERRPTRDDVVVFPPQGTSVRHRSWFGEAPNPANQCKDPRFHESNSPAMAVPAFVRFSEALRGTASGTYEGPSGDMPVCVLTAANTTGEVKTQLEMSQLAVVLALGELQPGGTYTVNVEQDGWEVEWSFEHDPNAGLPSGYRAPTITRPPLSQFTPVEPFRLTDTRIGQHGRRLTANRPQRIQITGSNGIPDSATAVSANLTVARQYAIGHLTAYDCSPTVPTASTINFVAGAAVPNQAVIPLDADGGICVVSIADADLIVDVNGFFDPGAAFGFVPDAPERLLDTRHGARLRAGEVRPLRVAGGASPAPSGAGAVALNLTAVRGAADGHLRVYPCGQASTSEVSNVNYLRGQTVANAAIVKVGARGEVCLEALTDVHVVVDINGHFTTGGYKFKPLTPWRLVDTRRGTWAPQARYTMTLPTAGTGPVPKGAKALSMNMTAVNATSDGHMTAYPCGIVPDASNLNVTLPIRTRANAAMMPLSGGGELCVYSLATAHLVVDINGVWM